MNDLTSIVAKHLASYPPLIIAQETILYLNANSEDGTISSNIIEITKLHELKQVLKTYSIRLQRIKRYSKKEDLTKVIAIEALLLWVRDNAIDDASLLIISLIGDDKNHLIFIGLKSGIMESISSFVW